MISIWLFRLRSALSSQASILAGPFPYRCGWIRETVGASLMLGSVLVCSILAESTLCHRTSVKQTFSVFQNLRELTDIALARFRVFSPDFARRRTGEKSFRYLIMTSTSIWLLWTMWLLSWGPGLQFWLLLLLALCSSCGRFLLPPCNIAVVVVALSSGIRARLRERGGNMSAR